jgi:hypothetical protein
MPDSDPVHGYRPSRHAAEKVRPPSLPEDWENLFRALHARGLLDRQIGFCFGRASTWACETRKRLGLWPNAVQNGYRRPIRGRP